MKEKPQMRLWSMIVLAVGVFINGLIFATAAFTTFQTKAEATGFENQLDRRLNSIENKLDRINEFLRGQD